MQIKFNKFVKLSGSKFELLTECISKECKECNYNTGIPVFHILQFATASGIK